MENVYEFIIWENCHNHCKFCVQDKEKDKCLIIDKSLILERIKKIILFLSDKSKFQEGSHLLILGGELFDDRIYFSPLKRLYNAINDMMLEGGINTLYLNTNLIYKDLEGLVSILDLFDKSNISSRIHFTTSYDTANRFKGKTKELMLSNLKKVREKYPKLNIVVNAILQEQTIKDILEKRFSVKEFEEKYGVYVNLIPYIGFDETYKPYREDLLKALELVNEEHNGEYMKRYGQAMLSDVKKNVYGFENNQIVNRDCDYLSCGHSENFKLCYKDSTECFGCDIEKRYNLHG